jgi:hypothetical protein
MMRSSIISTLYHILLSDQIRKGAMGGACGMHGRDEKYIQNVGQKH